MWLEVGGPLEVEYQLEAADDELGECEVATYSISAPGGVSAKAITAAINRGILVP